MSGHFTQYMRLVITGVREIETRIKTDRDLPPELRVMKWDLWSFIRLDVALLPEKGASPQSITMLQQVSSTLSELAIRMLLNDKDPSVVEAQVLMHAALLFEVHLEKLEHEFFMEEVNNE